MIHVACGGGQQGCTGAVTLQGELFTFGVLNSQQKKTARNSSWLPRWVDDDEVSGGLKFWWVKCRKT